MKMLEGKVAVITGGSRGLGFAIARAYSEAGARVVIGSRSEVSVERAVEDLRKEGAPAEGRVCDVAREQDVRALAEHAISVFGTIDIWVNNAGLSAPYGPTVDVPTDRFTAVLHTNILGTYYGSRVAMEHFLSRGGGKLINLLGRGDSGPVPMQNAYTSTKAWVRSFTRALAREYKGSPVGVYALNPGLVETEMILDVEVIEGLEEKVRPLETIVRMWGNVPAVPAQKALWIAGPATDGKSGLEVRLLTFRRIVTGALRELFRRILHTSSGHSSLTIRTVRVPDRG